MQWEYGGNCWDQKFSCPVPQYPQSMEMSLFSNSLIESWWRVLKHQWLYLNTLDTVATVRKLVAFYIDQHNTHLPHSAFHGQTPDEMYFGTGSKIPKKLEASRIAVRHSRMEANRAQTCQVCEETVSIIG